MRYTGAMVGGDRGQSQPDRNARRGAPIVLAHEAPFRIGEAEFRPALREVRFAGHTAITEPRVMQFLIALHRAAGAVVSKDDLLQSCWEGRIVGEDAINRVVSRLRGLAEKDAGRQFRIETITKVGYRLVPATGAAPEPPVDAPATPAPPPVAERAPVSSRRPLAIAATGLLALALAAGAWWWFRAAPAAGHAMSVQLTGFRSLSPDLPATLRDSINAEIVTAFNAEGVIAVSTAPAPSAAHAYLLDGTIYRVGPSIRVITRLTNGRSGAVLWSDSVDYAADRLARIPHKIAVDAGTVVRCGLSGAATYRKPLPDPVLSNYMRYCQEYWSHGGGRTLRFAQLVVAAVPDFSWGWSALGNGYMQAAYAEPDPRGAAALRAAGRKAEDRALALDPTNSEALAHKAHLIDQRDWLAQEALLRRAIAAQPLDCGCEHYGYGMKLQSVGRIGAAVAEFRAATDMLPLWSDSQIALADALIAAGQGEQARPHVAAAIDLSHDPQFDARTAISQGVETGDHAAAVAALRDPAVKLPDDSRAALLAGYEALVARDSGAMARAVPALRALPKNRLNAAVVAMLAALGAHDAALQAAGERPWLFWRRSMRGVLDEPAFPAVATKLGLMTYWRTSRTRPDICLTAAPPAFCRAI